MWMSQEKNNFMDAIGEVNVNLNYCKIKKATRNIMNSKINGE